MFPANVEPELMCVKMMTFRLLLSLATVDALIDGEISGAGRKSLNSCMTIVPTKKTMAAIQETKHAKSFLRLPWQLQKQPRSVKSNKLFYYLDMASSASGQDEPNRALWLATRADKMEPSCPLRTTRCIPQAKFHQKPYNRSCIDQVCAVKMAEYWPRSFFASLLTSTSSRSMNTQKKNLANIQPSWPLTWSITHTY